MDNDNTTPQRRVRVGVDMGIPNELIEEALEVARSAAEQLAEQLEQERWKVFMALVQGLARSLDAIQAMDMGRQPQDLEVQVDGLFDMATTIARRYQKRRTEESEQQIAEATEPGYEPRG